MKFYIRRTAFALITMPIIFVGYGFIYFSLALTVNGDSTGVGTFVGNLPSIGIAYLLVLIFAPQFNRLLDKLEA
jgi:hypothetical protein